nr:YhjD/YihY/BrkB family envelope integrity protein [Corynebacterium sp. TAE3-ERU12]
MHERYSQSGGNQFAAGITYFSVLSIFPLLMTVFAVIGFILRGDDQLLAEVKQMVTDNVSGGMGDTLTEIIDAAIAQAGGVFTVGFLTSLWSGLSWMNHLRMGVTAMWKRNLTAANFLLGKLRDFVRLVGIIVMIAVTFAVTAIGSSGFTKDLLDMVGLGDIPGISIITFLVALAVGLLANYLLFVWMLKALPRGETPTKSVLKGAILGAVGLEIVKQLGTVFFSNALSNPAGAVFGPIIGIMVVFYFVWRVTLYASAWTATTWESMQLDEVDAPAPAIIHIRGEAARSGGLKTLLGK